tara:strand:- start:737 stop:895 length:159 start_codon:yes stop_codon:yes gene_type:complete
MLPCDWLHPSMGLTFWQANNAATQVKTQDSAEKSKNWAKLIKNSKIRAKLKK